VSRVITLKHRIKAVTESTTPDLFSGWAKGECSLDICRITGRVNVKRELINFKLYVVVLIIASFN
jgi:hypothetical protein